MFRARQATSPLLVTSQACLEDSERQGEEVRRPGAFLAKSQGGVEFFQNCKRALPIPILLQAAVPSDPSCLPAYLHLLPASYFLLAVMALLIVIPIDLPSLLQMSRSFLILSRLLAVLSGCSEGIEDHLKQPVTGELELGRPDSCALTLVLLCTRVGGGRCRRYSRPNGSARAEGSRVLT